MIGIFFFKGFYRGAGPAGFEGVQAISQLEEAKIREEELNKLVTEARTSLAVEKGTQENLQNQQIPMSNRLKELEDLIVRR